MQPFLPGYRLTRELHRSNRSLVYRGIREADQLPVVIKTCNKDYPELADITRLRREHRILGALEIPGVIRALGLERWENNVALVMEDFDAQPLASQLGPQQAMALGDFFRLAIACTRVLSRIHQHVVHRDLNPRNILWNPATDEIRFIDFGLASEITRERQAPTPQPLVGSLAFVSPEQTGRLNRDVDFRTDFYSLGVTFYLLLTGRLPFAAADPMEWVYCHITQVAAPPDQINAAVPEVLGQVVLKLMAKNPEDRYQSAQGLMRDLVECHRQWQEAGSIAPFELARDDVMAQFHVPQRLYGRGGETQAILDAFQGAALAETALVVVSGPAGIGKSALVNDVRKAIVDRNGRFFEGKFDQFHRHGPYAAIAQALGGLVKQVMAEPEERLARLRARLVETLGRNGRIAVDLVPALAGIIGQPPPVAELNPTEEQNRFLATIQGLIAVFARPEHPLVLFLDDLQWSDAPTLVLMRRLLESGDRNALLLVGAHRDDEVHEGHPLLVALADIERTQRVRRLQLGPLDADTINRIVADALHADAATTSELSALVHRKTEGNPFFAGELLRTLHQDGLFSFDHEAGRWAWDLAGVRQAQISDDVVDFMVGRIQRLAPETQLQLRHAACLGDTFDMRLLARLVDQSLASATAAIWPAIAAGLIAPLSGEELLFPGMDDDGSAAEARCRFLHDRVRQAAYALNPEAERQRIHLRIGRLLLALTDADTRQASASEIAQQLNEGRALITDEAERRALATINLAAARKAKESAAYRSALDFTRVGRELLPPGAWESHYELAFETCKLHASCAYLSGERDVAQACYAELLAHTRTTLERAEVHAARAAQYTFASRMGEAIDEGIRALALLGIKLSPQPGVGAVLRDLARTKLLLGRRRAADLDGAPMVGDRKIRLAMKILEGFLVPAYLTGNDTLFATTVLRQAALSFRHGNCDESVSAYSGYAVLLAGLGDMTGAYEFGRLALRLGEQFGAVDSKCRTLVLYGLFSHSWSQPWGTLEPWFRASVEAGLQSGDFVFMAYACGYLHLWDPQVDLKTAVEEGRRYLALCKQTTYQNALDAAMCAQQFWLNMRGETAGRLSLSDADFDEAACLARMERARYVSGLAIFHLFKLQVACIHEDWDMAWRELQAADPIIKALLGSPYMVEYCVYGFQAAAQIATRRGPHAGAARRRLARCHRQMRAWARHCPGNFRHHALLMEAELARLKGATARAPMLYDAAIAAARQTGFVRYEAHANESAARHYRALGLDKVAATYLRDARDGYMRWGALAKVRALDEAAPDMPGPSGARVHGPFDVEALQRFNLGLVPQLVESGMLDLSTVWKATQAISGEATFERLLEKLMAIVKESAGAQRGLLVLREGEDGAPRYRVQAESLETGEIRHLQAEPLDHHAGLPVSLIRYVIRSQTSVVLGNACEQGAYTKDPYIEERRPKSVLAMPIVNQGHLLGVLYLENNVLNDAFTPDRVSVLQILAGQAAISLQNLGAVERAAYLEAERTIKDTYARELESRVEERTAELTEAYEQLMELDRMKTNFLSVVSHELRTPLTTIQGYAEFLEDGTGGALSEDQEDFVKQIQQGAVQLRRLVDDLLDFARLDEGSFKLVGAQTDMAVTVAEALEGLAPVLQERGLHIETRLPAEPAWAHADAGRISQVLLNLVGNAIKFTPRGGKITVALLASPAELRVEVADTGLGIDAEHLPKLFQKFFQVDSSSTRERGGVGLGLSIARSIVEAHGGQIGVDSVPGEGSTFWFTLPRHARAAITEVRAAGTASSDQ